MMKLLAIAIITPILVIGYTKLESTVSAKPVDQTQGGVRNATPSSLELMDNEKIKDADIINSTKNNEDYILVRSARPAINPDAVVKTNSRPDLNSNRFALVLL